MGAVTDSQGGVIERPVTLPEPFWSAMTWDEQYEVSKLERDRGLLLLPSGSRYICPGHHREDSDFDIYAHGEDERVAMGLLLNGWRGPREDGNKEGCDASSGGTVRSISLKKDNLNLILFFSMPKLLGFKDATDICRDLCVKDRDQRIKIFKEIVR